LYRSGFQILANPHNTAHLQLTRSRIGISLPIFSMVKYNNLSKSVINGSLIVYCFHEHELLFFNFYSMYVNKY